MCGVVVVSSGVCSYAPNCSCLTILPICSHLHSSKKNETSLLAVYIFFAITMIIIIMKFTTDNKITQTEWKDIYIYIKQWLPCLA